MVARAFWKVSKILICGYQDVAIRSQRGFKSSVVSGCFLVHFYVLANGVGIRLPV